MAQLPTMLVTIKGDTHAIRINVSDFDPETHRVVKEVAEPKAEAKAKARKGK